jgi:DNA-directed RNA polymerase subunit RPC12/RpoP
MLPTHDVPCPRCGKALYSAVSLEDGVDAGAVESPRVERDAAGYYMECPHCAQRVRMERVTAGSAEAWKPASS